jgi:hypothetical protein
MWKSNAFKAALANHKHQVDFLITRDRKPWLAVDCAASESVGSDFRSFLPKLGGPLPGLP